MPNSEKDLVPFIGSPAPFMIQGRQPAQESSSSKGFSSFRAGEQPSSPKVRENLISRSVSALTGVRDLPAPAEPEVEVYGPANLLDRQLHQATDVHAGNDLGWSGISRQGAVGGGGPKSSASGSR